MYKIKLAECVKEKNAQLKLKNKFKCRTRLKSVPLGKMCNQVSEYKSNVQLEKCATWKVELDIT